MFTRNASFALSALAAFLFSYPSDCVAQLGATVNLESFKLPSDPAGDDAPAFSRAIASGASKIVLQGKKYVINSPIDLTSSAANGNRFRDRPISIIGAGRCQMGPAGCTTIVANTGSVAIDTAGSQNVTLSDFLICASSECASGSPLGNPSKIGILMGRIAGNHYPQFHYYQRLHIFLPSIPSASARGTVGIYNSAAEHWNADDVYVTADLPIAFTASNVLNFTSPYAGTLVGPASMTLATLRNVGMRAWTQAGVEFWDTQNVRFENCYWSRQSGSQMRWAMNFNQNASMISATGQIEQFPAVANFNYSADHIDLSPIIVAPTEPLLGLNPIVIASSRFNIKQLNGVTQPLAGTGSGATISGSSITLNAGQTLVSPNLALKGTLVHAPGLSPSSVAVSADSHYLGMFDTQIQIK